MVTPIIFMVSTSFKSEFYFPRCRIIFSFWRSLKWMLNSSFSTASVLFFDSLVGYKFRGGSSSRFSVFMIPTEMLIIPWYMMSRTFGWIDTYWGIAFPGLMTGFGTFLMRQFFMSLPDELIDAARIDGWSEFSWRIEPLVVPALSALAIFHFLGNWTAFIWPLIVTNDPEIYTIPVGIASSMENFRWICNDRLPHCPPLPCF